MKKALYLLFPIVWLGNTIHKAAQTGNWRILATLTGVGAILLFSGSFMLAHIITWIFK